MSGLFSLSKDVSTAGNNYLVQRLDERENFSSGHMRLDRTTKEIKILQS